MMKTKGLYVSPVGIVKYKEYAKQLVDCQCVNQFIIRTGFDPQNRDRYLAEAVETIRSLGVEVCLLTGTWWGHDEKPIENLPCKSFESKFPMTMPGSSTDELISENLKELCKNYSPDSICLTHARYRHPAYIAGVFDLGDDAYRQRLSDYGVSAKAVLQAISSYENTIKTANSGELLQAAQNKDLIEFLCNLSGNILLKQFFDFKCFTINSSAKAFRQIVKQCGNIDFGANAFSPIASKVCGQDYDSFKGIYDFVQPLLGYMEWHNFETIAAWAIYFKQLNKELSEENSIELSKQLFKLKDAATPDTIAEINSCGEGKDYEVYSVVSKEIELVAENIGKGYKITPVLRGRTWSEAVSNNLINKILERKFDGIVFQGSEILQKPMPATGWN